MNKQNAFSLVEIILTLIIIILLLAYFYHRGHSVSTNAKLKNLSNEFHGVTAAIYSYQERYNALPGDVNGNNKIDGSFDSTQDGDEPRLFWLHLRQAGLIRGNPNNQQQPTHVLGGLIGVATHITTGKNQGIAGLFVGFSKIPQKIAMMIETQTDDGHPNTGSIQAHRLVAGQTIIIPDYSETGLYNVYFAL